METPQTIYSFWFGTHTDESQIAKEQTPLWWGKDAKVDEVIRQRFEEYVTKAANHELDEWLATPKGRLALILLTDQFPRNIYRNTPKSFQFDALARLWCKEGIDKGIDKELKPLERVFFYLPLEHSELLEDQVHSINVFNALTQSVEPENRSIFQGFEDYAIKHKDIIARFGRFPHRNVILGRASTQEELEFLKQPGSSF